MRTRTRLVLLTVVLVALCLTACASLSVKQRASLAHQTVRQTLMALDDFERVICQPAVADPSRCTSIPVLISDADHQQFSRVMVKAYDADIRIGEAIIAWVPGTPVPTDVAGMRLYAEQAKAIITALTPSPQVEQFFALILAVLEAVESTTLAFGGMA